jgi:hypothetical protein
MTAATASRKERLEGVYDALQRRDREDFRRRIVELMHPDCEWTPLITEVEGGGPYHGPDGMIEFFDDFLGSFEVRYVDPEFRSVGADTVLLLVTMQVRGRESDVEVPRELGLVFEFEDELVRRAHAHYSHDRAIAESEARRA